MVCAVVARGQWIQWYVSYDFAERMAKNSGKLLMVDLYTENSRSSRALIDRTYWQADVKQASLDFVPVRLNAAFDGARVAERYGVTKFTTILFLEPGGRLVSRVYGFQSASQLLFEMRRARTASSERRVFEPRLVKQPTDIEALLAVAKIKALATDTRMALTLLQRAEQLHPKRDHPRFAAAYTALADTYRVDELYDAAITHYRKAKKVARNPDEAAYAGINIGLCYRQQGSMAKAASELQTVLKLPGISDIYADRAQRIIATLNGAGRPTFTVSR
jgi:tetratricopeptide (TPR) repeat protein